MTLNRFTCFAGIATLLALLSPLLAFVPPYPFVKPTGPFAIRATTFDPKSYERKGAEYLTPTVDVLYPDSDTGQKFPLIFYFSGWPGSGVDGLRLARELVSHGFIVATVHYPYNQPGLSSEQLEQRRADLEHGMNFTSEDYYRQTIAFADQRARNRAQDASDILDALIRLNANAEQNASGARIDAGRVGIMGFSFGGSVAAQARRRDKRFRAALNMDGWHFAETQSGVEPPYLNILSDDTRYPTDEEISPSAAPEVRFGWLLTKRDFDQPVANMQRAGGILVRVSGAKHFNFSDRAFDGSLLRRLLTGVVFHRPGGLGPINPLKGFNLIAACSRAFFEIHLKDKSSSLLDNAISLYPETDIQKWTAVIQHEEK
jgi:dienelactone hydrolase